MTFFGWLVARIKGSRFIYYPFELYGEQPFSEMKIWLVLEQFTIQRTNILVTQNECRAQFYINKKGLKTTPLIIHNYKPFREIQQKNQLKRMLDLPENTKCIIYEGVLVQGRDLDKVVLSTKYLPENVKLIFIGPGKRDVVEGQCYQFTSRSGDKFESDCFTFRFV